MPYGMIRAKIIKQYESTRCDFCFCKSVKFLYSGCKETLQSGLQGLFIVSIQDTNHKLVD